MRKWILDTDHVSLSLRGNQDIAEQLARKRPNVVTTIVTVQEIYNGWVSIINRKVEPDDLVELYSYLAASVDFISSVPVLDFDENAKRHYVSLRQQNRDLSKKRLEKDVRIAAIASIFWEYPSHQKY